MTVQLAFISISTLSSPSCHRFIGRRKNTNLFVELEPRTLGCARTHTNWKRFFGCETAIVQFPNETFRFPIDARARVPESLNILPCASVSKTCGSQLSSTAHNRRSSSLCRWLKTDGNGFSCAAFRVHCILRWNNIFTRVFPTIESISWCIVSLFYFAIFGKY